MEGKKTGGRKKGVPNKITGEVREQFRRMFRGLAPDVERWIRETAEGVPQPVMVRGAPLLIKDKKGNEKPVLFIQGKDPGKAAELVLRLAEFHIPKLARTVISTGEGDEDKKLEIVIRTAAPDSQKP